MTTYVLRSIPERLEQQLNQFRGRGFSMPGYGYENVYGYAINLDERQIPDHHLTILLIMMTPHIVNQP